MKVNYEGCEVKKDQNKLPFAFCQLTQSFERMHFHCLNVEMDFRSNFTMAKHFIKTILVHLKS
jgi:hypothetical protein